MRIIEYYSTVLYTFVGYCIFLSRDFVLIILVRFFKCNWAWCLLAILWLFQEVAEEEMAKVMGNRKRKA
jgi:hypothetical protein